MAIEVLKPGLASTVQDAGRPGYYHLGIPLSGALDQESFLLGNWLVGNADNAAVLECTLLAPELRFDADALIAVTGAYAVPRLNGLEVQRNAALVIKAGDCLKFDFLKLGARLYIAVAGGIDVPVILGSRSTYGLGAFGGFQGRKLIAGDILPVGEASPTAKPGRVVLPGHLQPLGKEVTLRVLPGLYFHRVKNESIASFFADTWTVAPEADRIGYRYRHGRRIAFHDRAAPFGAGSDPSNIVDAGYPYGSIQIPGGSEPIILHRDAVSGGGYAMLGTVISADMDTIAQMQPNHKANFVQVSMEQALHIRTERKNRLQALRTSLA